MSTLFDAISAETGPNKRFVRLSWYELQDRGKWEHRSETDYDKALALVRAMCLPEWIKIFEATKP